MQDYILASGSIYRKQLLCSAGLDPKEIVPADIDETPYTDEQPADYVKRMALQKARAVHAQRQDLPVLAADTIVVCGHKIIQKAKSEEEQKQVMKMLSDTTHHVLTAVCLIMPDGMEYPDLSDTGVTVKTLSDTEIEQYIRTNDWRGSCGYNIEGMMESFIIGLNGSYSGVIGMPLCIVRTLFRNANLL